MQISASELGLMDANGQVYRFSRAIQRPQNNSGMGSQQQEPQQQQQASGQEYLLRGNYCSYSGSSSTYSGSYSSSTRAYFDGRGRFSYGSSTYSSGNSGTYYGEGGNQGNVGSYKVVGNNIYLTFPDGSSDVAKVNFRGNGGAITEIMYNGKLYGQGLCN